MSEWAMSDTCENCDEYDGSHCDNRNSDHYGHAVAVFHPVCGHMVKIEEYAHHVNCAVHNNGGCDCRDE